MSPLDLEWAGLSERRTSASGIVERFDVVKDVSACCVAHGVDFAVHALFL